jgi:hypothetical protein
MFQTEHENHYQHRDRNRDRGWRSDDAPNSAQQNDEWPNESERSEDQYARDASDVD